MAISINSVFEVRQGSSANNGGFFVTGASGVDYSQQASPQYALSGIASAGSGNTILSALAAADMVGNGARAVSGTNITVGTYEVVSVVVGVSITFSTNNAAGSICSGVAASGVINIGGALDLPSTADARMLAGNTCYVKANATYTISASMSFSATGTAIAPLIFIGYTTTRTDAGRPTFQRSSGNLNLFSVSGAFHKFYHFISDGNSAGTQTCWAITGTSFYARNCRAINFTAIGFQLNGTQSALTNCYATGGTSAATAAFTTTGASGQKYLYCTAAGNACIGFLLNMATLTTILYDRCISANNVGASTYDGFKTSNVSVAVYNQCVSYGNAGNGILLDTTTTATAGDNVIIRGCILYGNTGFGLSSNTTDYSLGVFGQGMWNFNAFGTNTAGARNNVPTGASDVALSGDPFTNGASLDFSLDASGLTDCMAASFPGTLNAGGVGYLDIGALQHQDSGGGSTTYVINQIRNEFYQQIV